MKRVGRKRILSFILVIIMLTSLCGFNVLAEDSTGDSSGTSTGAQSPGPVIESPTESVVPSPSEPVAPSPSESVLPSPSEPVVPSPSESVVPSPSEPVQPSPSEAATPGSSASSPPNPTQSVNESPDKQGLIPQGINLFISDLEMFEGQTETLKLFGKLAFLLKGTWTVDSGCDVVEITAGSSVEIKALKTGEAVVKCEYFKNCYISFKITVKKCTATGSFSVQKYIKCTTTPLSGATFTLSSTCNTDFSHSQTTGKSGHLDFTSLPPGNYTLTEAPPPNYAGAGPWEVTVSYLGLVKIEDISREHCDINSFWSFPCKTLTVYNAPLPTYSIVYDANGGSGAPPAETGKPNGTYTLTTTAPSTAPSGYTFAGWSKTKNDPNTKVTSVTIDGADVTVYALWSEGTPPSPTYYSIIYDANGGSGAPATETGKPNGTYTLTTTGPSTAPSGYTFAGWSKTKNDPSTKVTSVTIDGADVTVYAMWSEGTPPTPTYSIIYDANGGSGAPPAETGKPNGTYALTTTGPSTAPSGYTFAGWSKTKNDPNTKVTSVTIDGADVTVYALWSNNYIPPPFYFDSYTITYTKGAHGTFADQTYTRISGAETPAFDGTPSGEAGWTFTGWSPAVSKYVNGTVTYMAQWSSGTTPPSETNIPDSYPPLGASPEPSPNIIPDEGVPGAIAPVVSSDTPQTSDNSNILLMAILATLSVFGLGAIGVATRRKKHNK